MTSRVILSDFSASSILQVTTASPNEHSSDEDDNMIQPPTKRLRGKALNWMVIFFKKFYACIFFDVLYFRFQNQSVFQAYLKYVP